MMQAGTKTLTVHHNRENIRIPLDQIYYLESEGRVINVYGDIAREHFCTFYGKLKELPPILARNGFCRWAAAMWSTCSMCAPSGITGC